MPRFCALLVLFAVIGSSAQAAVESFDPLFSVPGEMEKELARRDALVRAAIQVLAQADNAADIYGAKLLAIRLLSKYRAAEAVDVLLRNLNLRVQVHGNQETSRDFYPAMGALIDIGEPCLAGVVERLGVEDVSDKEQPRLVEIIFALKTTDEVGVLVQKIKAPEIRARVLRRMGRWLPEHVSPVDWAREPLLKETNRATPSSKPVVLPNATPTAGLISPLPAASPSPHNLIMTGKRTAITSGLVGLLFGFALAALLFRRRGKGA